MANLTRSLVRQNLSRYLRIVNRPTRYTHLIVYKTTFCPDFFTCVFNALKLINFQLNATEITED